MESNSHFKNNAVSRSCFFLSCRLTSCWKDHLKSTLKWWVVVIFQLSFSKFPLNPLPPNNSMHTVYIVLYTFLKLLTRRLCLTVKSFFSWWSFPLFCDSYPSCVIQGWYHKEEVDSSHFEGVKGSIDCRQLSFWKNLCINNK